MEGATRSRWVRRRRATWLRGRRWPPGRDEGTCARLSASLCRVLPVRRTRAPSAFADTRDVGFIAVTDLDVTGAVTAAAAGEAAAWNALVDRYSGLVWAVARGEGLSRADAADVSQTTWLRLAEHVGRIRAPERVGSWLATTARHECWRLAKTASLVSSVEPERLGGGGAGGLRDGVTRRGAGDARVRLLARRGGHPRPGAGAGRRSGAHLRGPQPHRRGRGAHRRAPPPRPAGPPRPGRGGDPLPGRLGHRGGRPPGPLLGRRRAHRAGQPPLPRRGASSRRHRVGDPVGVGGLHS